jgi:tetratricopeptide (TPR) repeat protein
MPPTTARVRSASAEPTLSTGDLASLMRAGMTYLDSGRFEEAREIFSAIRSRYPSERNAEIGLGSTCFSEGQFEAAVGHYLQALKLNPCDAYAYALLGESQIFLGKASAARVSLWRACEIDPKGPYGRLAQTLLRLLEFLPNREFPKQDWSI